MSKDDLRTDAVALHPGKHRRRVGTAAEFLRCGAGRAHQLPRAMDIGGGRRGCAGRADAHQQQQGYDGDERGEDPLTSASSSV